MSPKQEDQLKYDIRILLFEPSVGSEELMDKEAVKKFLEKFYRDYTLLLRVFLLSDALTINDNQHTITPSTILGLLKKCS